MRRVVLVMAGCGMGLAATIGCVGQPFVADYLGLFPGPSTTLLADVLGGGSLLSELISGLGQTSETSSGTSGTTDTSSSSSGSSDTSSTDSHGCQAGEVWVGTVTLNGVPISINACVPESLARQYGVI